jgi:Tc5 transposase DNA-binding domain
MDTTRGPLGSADIEEMLLTACSSGGALTAAVFACQLRLHSDTVLAYWPHRTEYPELMSKLQLSSKSQERSWQSQSTTALGCLLAIVVSQSIEPSSWAQMEEALYTWVRQHQRRGADFTINTLRATARFLRRLGAPKSSVEMRAQQNLVERSRSQNGPTMLSAAVSMIGSDAEAMTLVSILRQCSGTLACTAIARTIPDVYSGSRR